MDAMKPGDVVELKCGGPKMVICEWAEPRQDVEYLNEPPQPGWRCTWTIQRALRSAVIPPVALRVVEPAG